MLESLPSPREPTTIMSAPRSLAASTISRAGIPLDDLRLCVDTGLQRLREGAVEKRVRLLGLLADLAGLVAGGVHLVLNVHEHDARAGGNRERDRLVLGLLPADRAVGCDQDHLHRARSPEDRLT